MSFLIFAKRSSSILTALVSFSTRSRVKTCTSITTPDFDAPIRNEESLTLLAFSPKIARNNFSSGESTVSLFGVTLPTRISPPLTRAPT